MEWFLSTFLAHVFKMPTVCVSPLSKDIHTPFWMPTSPIQNIQKVVNFYSSKLSYQIEKISKISYRTIDLSGLLYGPLQTSFVQLSSHLKDIALGIESTNFFFVSYPLFVHDPQGRSFFQTRTKVQCAETLSLTVHLFLKMFVGAERAGLLRLGIIGTYAIGHVSLFRYALEGFILMFNFFGTWDGTRKLTTARKELSISQNKLDKWHERKNAIIDISPASLDNPFNEKIAPRHIGKWSEVKIENKLRKWTFLHEHQEINKTKAWFKIAAKVSKLILITFAVTLATINVMTTNYLIVILNLGIISDGIGLMGFYYNEYWKNFIQ